MRKVVQLRSGGAEIGLRMEPFVVKMVLLRHVDLHPFSFSCIQLWRVQRQR